MANRRMLSRTIVESDSFCCLSNSSQNLYIHLIMNADDDGFVDMWKSVLRYLSIKRSALDALVDCGYLIMFDDGVILIADWLVHNTIKLDRYKRGRYRDRLDIAVRLENDRYIKASG